MKTILNDRELWYDGAQSMSDSAIADWILANISIDNIYCKDQNSVEIKNFNKLTGLNISKKIDISPLNTDWNIPPSYLSLDIKKYVKDLLMQEILSSDFDDNMIAERVKRVNSELKMFYDKNMEYLLRTIIYIVDMFKQNNIVWGTGRGSSCASYILYIIGLHDVDSVFYDINISEFFKNED